MSKRPWMPLYIPDYLADTAHFGTIEHGAYLLLIMHYWATGGLPDDDRLLARITKMSPHQWLKVRPLIQPLFQVGWKHKRIEKEISEAQRKYQRRVKAGKLGANQRWGDSNAMRMPLANACQPQPQPDSQIEDDGGGSARARADRPLISPEAFAFSDEIAKLCGYDPKLAPQWVGAPMRVQMMLTQGWSIDAMRETAQAIVRRKRQRGEELPGSIRYFESAFARAQAPPLPLPTVQILKESPHAQTTSYDRRTPWQIERDKQRAALAALGESVERDKRRESGG